MFVAADKAELLVAVLSVPRLLLWLSCRSGFRRGDIEPGEGPRSFLTDRPRRRKS